MKFVLLCVCAVLFAGAASAQVDVPGLTAELNKNRQKWRGFGVTTYSLKETISCFCPPEFRGPFDVKVVNNAITEIAFSADSNLPGTPDDSLKNSLLTIEGAFARLEDLLGRSPPVARVNVEYDARLGYIRNFFVDIDERIADEEQSFSFELLTPVDTNPPQPPVPVPVPTPSPPADRRALLNLRVNIGKWRAVGPKVYKYRLRRLCFCFGGFTGPFLISVSHGKVVDVVFEGEGPKPAKIDVPTIDGLFDIIRDALEGPRKAASITVKYDFRTGAPTNIAIDRIKLAVDDEITYTAEIVEGLDSIPIDINPFPIKEQLTG